MKVALYALSSILVVGPVGLWVFLLSYYGHVPDEAAVILAGVHVSLRLVSVLTFMAGVLTFLGSFFMKPKSD